MMRRKWMMIAVLSVAAGAASVPAAAKTESKAPVVKKGYRVISLPMEQHQLVGLSAGDRVDMMVTFEALIGKDKPQEKEPVTATLLQNILVYKKHATVVDLIVNPNEAQYAALAIDQKRNLWLIRRGQGDEELHPMEMASFRKLFR